MRYSELLESMSFSAGHKDPKSNYWVSDTDSGDPYTDEFYKNTDKYMYSCLLYTSPSPRDIS